MAVAQTDPTTARVGEVIEVDYEAIRELKGGKRGEGNGKPPPPPDPNRPKPVTKPQPPPEEKPEEEEDDDDGEGEDGEPEEGEDQPPSDDDDTPGGGGSKTQPPKEGEGGEGGTLREDIKTSENNAKDTGDAPDYTGMDKVEPRTSDHECGAAGMTPEMLKKVVEEAQRKAKEEGAEGAYEGTDQGRIEEMRKDTAKDFQRRDTDRRWGRIKGGKFVYFQGDDPMRRWAKEASGPPRVKWETLLKRSLRTLVGRLNDEVKNDESFERYSRRTYSRYAGKRTPLEPAEFSTPEGFDVALIVDTSVSVDDYGLGQSLREAGALLNAPGVAKVLFIAADWAVSAVTEIVPEGVSMGRRAAVKKLQPMLVGGRGTDMAQSIRYVLKVNKERRRKGETRIPAAVVFTDGGTCDICLGGQICEICAVNWPKASEMKRSKLEIIVVLISPGNSPEMEAYTKAGIPYAKVIVAQ